MSTNRVICQIYMESTFNAKAGVGQHGALGLMQMQKPAVRQVFKNREQQRLGHMPNEAQSNAAFAQADALYGSDDMVDEATNIQLGTEYLQYWLTKLHDEAQAYAKYRGTPDPYYQPISMCASQLDADPENVQILHQLHH
jgi:hypothetical protein